MGGKIKSNSYYLTSIAITNIARICIFNIIILKLDCKINKLKKVNINEGGKENGR